MSEYKTYLGKAYYGWTMETFVFDEHDTATVKIATLKSHFGPVTRITEISNYEEYEEGGHRYSIGKVLKEIEYDCKGRWTKKKCIDLHNKAVEQFKLEEVE